MSYHTFINVLSLAGLISLLSLVGLVISLISKKQTGVILSLLGLSLFPSLMIFGERIHKPRPQAGLTACKSNLKNIALALEMYANDFGGSVPENLGSLTPGYLKTIPTCPVSRTDTYSGSYLHGPPKVAGAPWVFTICCQGNHHFQASVAADRPLYTSSSGLVDR